MIVKIHPHRTKVTSGETKVVSVTPDVPGGRAYYKGTVILKDAKFRIHQSGVNRAVAEQVRNVHAWCVGELYEEYDHIINVNIADVKSELVQVTYHYNIGRFVTLDGRDVTDVPLEYAVCSHRNFYVKEA